MTAVCLTLAMPALASIFARVQGVVHDPQHRPVAGAEVTLRADSGEVLHSVTNLEGTFQFVAVSPGSYNLTVAMPGFRDTSRQLTLVANASPIFHIELALAGVRESITATANSANTESATPATLLSRIDIEQTPGADRTNSLQMITDYVPGAYMTHDMLHMRGGHQVSWLIDGIEIPETNIASNLGPQIDPKDIEFLEAQRGSYTADEGDRTYGIFNIAPRNGFSRNNEGELIATAGNYWQTNDQINLGSHTERFAYYASLNGNRSNYGLAPPVDAVYHDAANGLGGFLSLIYNRTARDQFRLITSARGDYFQIPYDPDPGDFENQQFNSSGLRDAERERDAYAAGTWAHTFNANSLLQISPLYHFNSANYDSSPADTPVATTEHRTSQYAGVQASIGAEYKNHYLQAGIFGYGQHDALLLAVNPGLAPTSYRQNGGLVEAFISDNYKITDWLTLLGGVRQSHFQGGVTDNSTSPRIGVALRIPRIQWVFRGFYGHFYQPPPLITAQGPIVQYANQSNTTILPLHGERDEEHQFGLQIPLRGWMLDADTFKTRANNFLDHANIGESSIYVPVTVDGALIRAWELTLRSSRIAKVVQLHLAYSNQVAQQRGRITGGLVCAPFGSPRCDPGFNYIRVDHDQRNTLSTGANVRLPWQSYFSTNVTYGSGFTNGVAGVQGSPYTGSTLPAHTGWDISAGKQFSENWSASMSVLNVVNERTLLDSSLTFGGFHTSDPRQVYGELRWRFSY